MSGDFSGKKVLVVDNSAVMTRIIKNNLVKIGFQDENISISNEGNQATLMLDFVEFDLITSGLHLRLTGGPELLKIVRSHGNEKIKNTPFLIISSESEEYFIQELGKSGVSGYLHKPFGADEIEKAINNIFCPEGGEGEEKPADQKKNAENTSPPQETTTFSAEIVSVFTESAIEALEQYMVTAVAGEPVSGGKFSGDLVSTINLTDPDHDVELTLVTYFPKSVACKIYEGIFGEVDMEQVCGIVQELGNIIGGNLKPRFAELSPEVFSLAHPGNPVIPDADNPLNFNLGLPETTMGGQPEVDLNNNSPKLAIPFTINEEEITMVCIF